MPYLHVIISDSPRLNIAGTGCTVKVDGHDLMLSADDFIARLLLPSVTYLLDREHDKHKDVLNASRQ